MTKQPKLGATSFGSYEPEDIVDGIRNLIPPALLAKFDAAIEADDAERITTIFSEIVDTIDGLAPKGAYFGQHPDDRMRYGFWAWTW